MKFREFFSMGNVFLFWITLDFYSGRLAIIFVGFFWLLHFFYDLKCNLTIQQPFFPLTFRKNPWLSP